MAEGGEEDQEKSEYKDHYKRILADLIGRRNSAGLLENEEAIEGVASNSFSDVVAAGSSQDTVTAVNEMASTSSSTAASSHSLTPSLHHTLMDESEEDQAVFHRRVTTSEPGAAYSAVSDNQLLNDRKTPEGDLPSPVKTAAPEVGLSLTPEPSLMSLSNERDESESGPEDGHQKRKKWKIFKGLKKSLVPK